MTTVHDPLQELTPPAIGVDSGGPTDRADVAQGGSWDLSGPDPLIVGGVWTRRLKPFVRPSSYYVLSRLAVLFAALGARWFAPRLNLLGALTTGWDGHWFTLIAQHGYPHQIIDEGHGSRWAYFPAWPLIIRGTVEVTRISYPLATLCLSLLLGLTSAIAVWLCIREVFGPVIADRSVLLYVFFPAAYVLTMGYAEGLFITTAGVCLYALCRHSWITASLCAVLCGLTRSFGVVLVACVVVAGLTAFFGERRARSLLAVAIAPLGFVSWLAYSWLVVGTPFAFVRAERVWGDSHFVWFTTPILSMFDLFRGREFNDGQIILCVIGLVFVYAGIVLLARAGDRGVSIPLFWWVFTIGSALAMMSSYEPDSVLRYCMPVVTVFAAYAWRMRPQWEGPVVGMLAVSEGMLTVIALVGSLHPHTAGLWP